ncbi:MAG: ExeM/NucH family extracellular endonuclease [Wenzhouxiangella sp.]
MKTRLLALLLAVSFSFSGLAWAQPQVIAYWAQNDNNLPGGGFGFSPATFPLAADVGAGNITLANFNANTVVNDNGDTVYQFIQSFAGTTLNAQPGFASGGSLAPQGAADTSNNGMHILIAVSTEGFEGISLSWAQQRTNTGFNSTQVAWSADGGANFTNFGNTGVVPNSFAVQSFDFSAVEALNDAEGVVFRLTLDGATAQTGNNRFDNITVSGSPLGAGPPGGESIPYELAFTTNPYTVGWTRQTVSGRETWDWNANFGNVTFTGFGGGATGCVPTESWFISPGFDLDSQDGERLFVDVQRGFAGDDPLTLWFSNDYSGSGDPNDATWTLLDTITPAQFSANNTTVTFGPYLQLRDKSGTGFFAARGLYQTGDCSTWRLMAIRIDTETAGGPFACTTDPADDENVTRIHSVQGPGAASPLVGETVEIQAIVVGAFQDTDNFQIGGFFLQEPDARADSNPLTSEGVFISAAQASVGLPDVAIGDEVRVRGVVREQFGQTEVFQVNAFESCASDRLDQVSPVELNFPVASLDALEAVEGMWVRLTQPMAVTAAFNAARFAEFDVAPERLFEPTQVVSPGAEAQALLDLNNRSRLIIDQGTTGGYRFPFQPGLDGSPLNAGNPIRSGFRIQSGFDGVMGFAFGSYRLFALQPAEFDASENPRSTMPPALPDGNLRVAVYNVENLFATLAGPGVTCGPGTLSCRGATTEGELARQLTKLSAALLAFDADIIGLNEIENDADDATLALLVGVLNDASDVPDWAFIPTGFKGTDAIKNAIIFRSSRVVPFGSPAILQNGVDVTPPFNSNNQRPVLKQAFRHLASAELMTVSVFHLRSKNCGANATGGNADSGDGQGCWNALRAQSTEAFLAWLETDPTGAGTDLHLVVGDFNSYAQEDPMRNLIEAGFVSEVIRSNDNDPAVYSFVFQGQSGSLDHLLASPALSQRVLGAAAWPINADEIPQFSYAETFPQAGSPPKPADFFAPDMFRSSDHDPLLASILLTSADDQDFVLVLGTDDAGSETDFGTGVPGQVLTRSGRLINGGSAAAELNCGLSSSQDGVFASQPPVIAQTLGAGAGLDVGLTCTIPSVNSSQVFAGVLSCTLDGVPAGDLALSCAAQVMSDEPIPVPLLGLPGLLLLMLSLLGLGLARVRRQSAQAV